MDTSSESMRHHSCGGMPVDAHRLSAGDIRTIVAAAACCICVLAIATGAKLVAQENKNQFKTIFGPPSEAEIERHVKLWTKQLQSSNDSARCNACVRLAKAGEAAQK